MVADSFASGQADQYSDVDLNCLVSDEDAPWFREHWPMVVQQIVGDVVLAVDLPGLIGGLVLTPSWDHVDFIVHTQSRFTVPGQTS